MIEIQLHAEFTARCATAARTSTSNSGRAMTCAACHHQERLGSFNWPMDRVVISSYIKGGQMPRGYTLQPAARSELYAKLIQEYFSTDAARPGILKSWLLGKTQ